MLRIWFCKFAFCSGGTGDSTMESTGFPEREVVMVNFDDGPKFAISNKWSTYAD